MVRSEDRLTLARIAGVTRRHAGGGPMSGEQEALSKLAEVAGGRLDLLAEHTEVILGAHEDDIDPPASDGSPSCASARAPK
jgi:hypothetical protein